MMLRAQLLVLGISSHSDFSTFYMSEKYRKTISYTVQFSNIVTLLSWKYGIIGKPSCTHTDPHLLYLAVNAVYVQSGKKLPLSLLCTIYG